MSATLLVTDMGTNAYCPNNFISILFSRGLPFCGVQRQPIQGRSVSPSAGLLSSRARPLARRFSVSFYWSYRLWRKALLTVQRSPLGRVVRDSIERLDGGGTRREGSSGKLAGGGKNREQGPTQWDCLANDRGVLGIWFTIARMVETADKCRPNLCTIITYKRLFII